MPAPRDVTLRPLERTEDDLAGATVVAARAFQDDPFFVYLQRRAVRRMRGQLRFWQAVLASAGPAAQLTGAFRPDGQIVGVAAVVPPGAYPLAASGQLRQLAGGLHMLSRSTVLAGLRYFMALGSSHPKDTMWYLLLLAVDPAAQRSGIGGRLQAAMLEAADADGLDSYLETQNPDNLPYYRRFGYDVERELRPVTGGPSLWTMRRPPR